VTWFGVADRKPLDLVLPGRHNQYNAQAAFLAATQLGVSPDDSRQTLRNFRGLRHRLQLVHEANGVRYFNDSIATIPEAAIAALDSFPPKTVIQIVGGSEKGLSAISMCNALVERAKAVLCIGETGKTLAEMMSQSTYHGAAAVYDCGDLATAMKEARAIALPGDVVLLSPGYASYDQFTNFEERGATFAILAAKP
jgi:UDP-N-acetylmuramoylalanine--D-glutamate ligase